MRNALINWLKEKAKERSDIILITGDLGYSVLEPFIELHGSRFINAGVAEQNMTGIAAGLALEELRPYIYSIGIFPTFRCAEQIRNDIDYHNLPVVICAIGSGVAYGNLGYSHHAIQDLALMRSLPNMTIGTPCDPQQVIKILDYQFKNPQPLYLRLHKAGEQRIDWAKDEIKPGRLRRIWPDKEINLNCNTAIICAGHIAKLAIEVCKEKGSEYPIYSIPLWGSKTKKDFAEQISQFKTIITIEDHIVDGGFGSYTLEVTAQFKINTQVIPVCLKSDIVGKVAKEETLIRTLESNLQHAIDNVNRYQP